MGSSNNRLRIAIFASGSGSNAEQIYLYFLGHPFIQVALIFSNNKDAGVFNRFSAFGIPTACMDNRACGRGEVLINLLREHRIDYIVLAGYLRLIPKELIEEFPNRILNIHPALLPKYGGKGMYGQYVHQSVFDNKESESGLTIHFVDAEFDEGSHIFQVKTDVSEIKSSEGIAKQVLRLEHQFYPPIIEQVVLNDKLRSNK